MQYDLRKGGIIMAVKTSDNIKRYQNPGGPEIGTVSRRIIERDGLVFKDIDGSGQVTAVNDWRLPPEERAAAYVKVLSVKENNPPSRESSVVFPQPLGPSMAYIFPASNSALTPFNTFRLLS